jgi:hypothetical protein
VVHNQIALGNINNIFALRKHSHKLKNNQKNEKRKALKEFNEKNMKDPIKADFNKANNRKICQSWMQIYSASPS